MKLIVGLGNPGKKYENTRHNIGFMALDYYCQKNNLQFTLKNKFEAMIVEFNYSGEKIVLVKPQTYMNLSGKSVRLLVEYYDVDIEDLLIVFDDLSLDFGTIKLKNNSSSGGHNGIKSIIDNLQTKAFLRLKLGINSPEKRVGRDFVLSSFNAQEKAEINDILEKVYLILDDWARGDSKEQLMNQYN